MRHSKKHEKTNSFLEELSIHIIAYFRMVIYGVLTTIAPIIHASTTTIFPKSFFHLFLKNHLTDRIELLS